MTAEPYGSPVVALFSGGLDSTALLYHLRDEGHVVLPLSIWYGQRHARELESVRGIWDAMGINGEMVDLHNLRTVLAGSSQTSDIPVPEGHYAEDNMKVTIVPNRNMVLLATAVAYAISSRAEYVAYAAHKGDHDQYPDCRQEFIDALSGAIALCDYNPPKLIAPYSQMTKAEIVIDGTNHGARFDLSWSCYKGGTVHCGRCGTCVERAEAFHLASYEDPTTYLDTEYWKEVCQIKG